MKLTKKRKEVNSKVDSTQLYSLDEATKLVKQVNTAKFDASVDLHIRLGLDPKQADQALRGTVSLPNGTGKTSRILVLCSPDKEQEAKDAGADFVGLDDLVEKITGGWTDFDVVIATPNVMAKVGKLGRVLGPRNLMPNPKTGTITMDIANTVSEIKRGKISFRLDKFGIIHSTIGRVSFDANKLEENAAELLTLIAKMKPSSAKGTYFKGIHMASTMSPGIQIDVKSVKGI